MKTLTPNPNCTCNAYKKEHGSFLYGVHSVHCNVVKRVYPEVAVSIAGQLKPVFPKECPYCGAAQVSERLHGMEYYFECEFECGGRYEYKSQIQNHTNKWWGSCPS